MASTRLAAAFAQAFGAPPSPSPASPVRVARAPGRVTLIGEHIDYCGLPVLPMALRQSVRIAFQPRSDRTARLVNRDPRFAPSSFAVSESIPPAPPGDWTNYARAAVWAIAQPIPGIRGVDAPAERELPIAAGLARESTQLNSRHPVKPYAAFCLTNKKHTTLTHT